MQGKFVVITGAFGVLGRAVAARAASEGARVALIDYAESGEAPPGAIALGGVDLTDADAAARAINAAREAGGPLHALFNIAGGFTWQTLAEGGLDGWERMFAINVKTAFNASKAALPHLIETGGAIVNVGAAGALKAGAGMGAYAAAKAGVHKLTESLAEEMKGKVRVNAVLPSVLDTAQNRKGMPKTDPGLWVNPDDLAAVMLFLASDAARDVTGALVPVTGRV